MQGKLRFDRIGIKLAETFKKGYRLTHEWALAYGSLATRGCVELDAANGREFMMGRDVWPELAPGTGEVRSSVIRVTRLVWGNGWGAASRMPCPVSWCGQQLVQ